MGGTAYLSLESPDEPFLHGVKFTAMPPTKRFRDMEQLSGGEKVMTPRVPRDFSYESNVASVQSAGMLSPMYACCTKVTLRRDISTPDHDTCEGCEHAPLSYITKHADV